MPRSNDPAEPQSESADLFAEPSSQHSSMRSGSEQVAGNMSPRSTSSASALQYGSEMGSVSQMSSASTLRRGGPRGDLGIAAVDHRTVQIRGMEDEMAGDDGQPRLYVWGTRICVADVQRSFRDFLTTFKISQLAEDENMMTGHDEALHEIDVNHPYYMERLLECNDAEVTHINLNLKHLNAFSEALYRKVIAYPADVIPYLDIVVNEVFAERFNRTLAQSIELRPFNAQKTRNMRGLNPNDVDQLITISGMVTRTSSLIPEMRSGYFQCAVCAFGIESEVDKGRIEEPVVCTNCSNTHCFQLVHNRSVFLDKQVVKLQESPDDMPSGETPHTVSVYAHGSLVESVQPGDRITVTGIFRATGMKVNPKQRVLASVYRTSIDALHFRKMDTSRLHQDNGETITEERIQQIIELSKRPDIMDALAQSIAPSIYEHDDVKRGLLCLLFGGTRKDDETTNKTKLRSEINILLCGDPGTSKSQMLQYVYRLLPRSQYTSGKGSSAVGLTASVSRDADTKQLVLQTGALVLADNGVCCIDEFDKMNESARSVLHEVMEQQTLSIAKAGIICQLNARASVLAAANPVDSKWNRNKTIVENITLPHTLLSRFDLIFLIVDAQDEMQDRRLGNHLVSLYFENDGNQEKTEHVDMNLLRDYIAYAKANIHPKLSEEASQFIIEKYLFMRKAGAQHGQITAYPRQLESLIRLSEAHAKIRLSQEVSVDDVEKAFTLWREALKQSAVDPSTGRVDVAILASGMSASGRKAVEAMCEAVLKQLKTAKGFVTSKALFHTLKSADKTCQREVFDEAISELSKKESIARSGDRIRFQTEA